MLRVSQCALQRYQKPDLQTTMRPLVLHVDAPISILLPGMVPGPMNAHLSTVQVGALASGPGLESWALRLAAAGKCESHCVPSNDSPTVWAPPAHFKG